MYNFLGSGSCHWHTGGQPWLRIDQQLPRRRNRQTKHNNGSNLQQAFCSRRRVSLAFRVTRLFALDCFSLQLDCFSLFFLHNLKNGNFQIRHCQAFISEPLQLLAYQLKKEKSLAIIDQEYLIPGWISLKTFASYFKSCQVQIWSQKCLQIAKYKWSHA